MTHAFARAPPLNIKLEHCIHLWSHPVFSSRWVTTAIHHTKNTLKETALTRQVRPRISRFCCSQLPFSTSPSPRLSSHGRILRITQFTPLKASNQWAVKPYWSESECQRRKGKGLNKNRKWNSTSNTTKKTRGKSLHVQGHGFFNKTRQPPCECRSRWNTNVKGQNWGALSIKHQNLSGVPVGSRQRVV